MSNSKLNEVLNSIASINVEIKEIRNGCDQICNSLAHRIDQIQKQSHDQVFNCRVEKSSYITMLNHGFSATIQEWSDFLVPILSENTGDNWKLVAYWDGHVIQPGFLEKYLLKEKSRTIINSYRVALESDNPDNTPIVFKSDTSHANLGYIQNEENPNSIFLDDGGIDIDKMETFTMFDTSEHFDFTNKNANLYLKYEKEYPFLREHLIERAESIILKEMSYDKNESEMGE